MTRATFDARSQAALSFLFSEMTYVEQEVLRQPYPQIKYPQIIPIDTSAPDYAESVAFKTFDFSGEPQLLGDRGNDIPLIETASNKGSVTVHEYALGYDYTLTELNKAQELARMAKGGAINYLAEKPNAVRRATEQFLDKAFFLGDGRTADVTTGLLNDSAVPTDTTGSFLPGGTDKTIQEILDGSDAEAVANELLQLFNGAILEVFVNQTNSNFYPTHILLPLSQYGKMTTFRIPNTSETLVSYLERVLGVTFESLLHLSGIGAGGEDRMVVYTRDEQYVKGHMPHAFALQAPATANNITFVSGGIVRIAGTELRIPKQHLYVDGV